MYQTFSLEFLKSLLPNAFHKFGVTFFCQFWASLGVTALERWEYEKKSNEDRVRD